MSAMNLARALRLALAEEAIEAGNAGEVEFWARRAAEGDVAPSPRETAMLRPEVESVFDSAVAFENLRQLLDAHDCRPHVSPSGQGSALCPSHDDRGASLRFKDDNRLLINCRAGCRVDEVLQALNVDWSRLGGLR